MSVTRRIAAFIRHADYHQLADTPSALQPFAITSEGAAAATQSAIAMYGDLQEKQWQLDPVVHTSSSLRAWQTAQRFIAQLQEAFIATPELVIDDALTERSVGSAANLTVAQIEQVIRDDPRYADLPTGWKSDSYFKLPLQGAESLMEAGERVAAYLNRYMQAMPDRGGVTVKLFFGHGASFRHAAHVLGVLDIAEVHRLSMYHAQPVFLEYLGEQGWQHVAGKWKTRTKAGGYTD